MHTICFVVVLTFVLVSGQAQNVKAEDNIGVVCLSGAFRVTVGLAILRWLDCEECL